MDSLRSAFPPTRVSVVHALASDDRAARHRAHDAIAAMYWKPVYAYIRLRWNATREDAEDLTQDFFHRALEKEWLAEFDAARARFRTFLRTCVDRNVMNARRAATREKRGGVFAHVSMDFVSAEAEIVAPFGGVLPEPDELFRRAWIHSVFESAVAKLKSDLTARGKGLHYELFSRYDLSSLDTGRRPTYAELGHAFEIPPTQVTNFLALARRRFREIVLDLLAETTGDERDYADSVRELLGVMP
jgi:DNA-directed RNA polymerase specialized sigma24 family protein